MKEQRWPEVVLVAVVAGLVGLFAAVIGLTDASARDETFLAHPLKGQHLHAPLRLALGLEPSAHALEPGSTLDGGKIVSYFEGDRGAKSREGTGRGRMIYTGSDAWEPTLGVDKNGNIFFQGMNINNDPTVMVSRDSGRSWDEVTPLTHQITLDPMLYVDTRTDRTFTADWQPACTTVSHTDDAGQSWTTSEACGLADKQNVFAGPAVSSPTVGYPNVVYMCAIDLGAATPTSFGTSCLKSLDGGITWVRTGAPAYTDDPRREGGDYDIPGHCGGAAGHGVVDNKGVVYLPRGWCGQPYLAISNDEGATWEAVQVASNGMAHLQNGIPFGSSKVFEHEAAVAVDAHGNVYYSWTASNRLPYLATSRNGGKSFSEPIMVGPPGLKEAWGPTINIGSTGKIALAYVGSTNSPGGKVPDGAGPEYTDSVTWNGYITTSVDVLSKRPRFFTVSVNPLSDPIMRGECPITRCGVQGDFIDVVIGADGRPWTSMVDGCPPPGDTCMDMGQGFIGTVVRGPKLR